MLLVEPSKIEIGARQLTVLCDRPFETLFGSCELILLRLDNSQQIVKPCLSGVLACGFVERLTCTCKIASHNQLLDFQDGLSRRINLSLSYGAYRQHCRRKKACQGDCQEGACNLRHR